MPASGGSRSHPFPGRGWGMRPEIGAQQAPPQPRRGPQVPATAARCTLRQSTPAARRVSGRPS